MKKILTLVFTVSVSIALGQWSNTTNQFYDTLHSQVSIAAQTQRNPIVLTSYPDEGYFVIWEDERNTATTKTDIYAQKYDKAGNRLWAQNGVPVANGPNAQHYVSSSNQDYRNRSFVATDSAGGFFISYVDDSVTNYYWERMAVQHVRSNGTVVFGATGYIVAQTPAGESFTYSAPYLIPDGNKGFFLSFSKNATGQNYIYVFGYTDNNGVLSSYGGGRVNDNAIQRTAISPCGIRGYIEYPGTSVQDYHIWYDGQGGCNVVMSMNGNTAGQGRMLCYNRIWRARKDSRVRTYYRNNTGVACPRYTDYKKGEVYQLYTLTRDEITTACASLDGQTVYVVTSERLTSNGYSLIDDGAYDYLYPRGITLQTVGNINVDLIAVGRRTNVNNTVSNFTIQAYAYSSEKYDSVPFQRAANNNPDIGFNTSAPKLDKLEPFRDTILASGNYYPDFSIAGAANQIYAASLMSTTGDRLVRLQHLVLEKKSQTSYGFAYRTDNKSGVVIGKEINTGFGGSNISYDLPMVILNSKGNALFYIREYYRSARVSPIINGAELAWGAMGRPIGTGVYNNSYYNFEQPYVSLSATDGRGVMGWRDNRNGPGLSGDNIFMRHLDSLNEFDYLPPRKPVKLIPNPYGGSSANPAALMGTSNQYSTIEIYNYNGSSSATSPIVEILDKYNLGRVEVNVQQNSGTIRKYNNKPYLDRNFAIKTESNPPAASVINLRLFFTTAEFNALKALDASIVNPGDLVVIQQANNTASVPAVYAPVAGERVITPVGWSNVEGGYYIELAVSNFGNFFIQKTGVAELCPGGDGSIVSTLSGVTYQWQLSTGGGFSNIVNNGNYSGVNTNKLELNNVPSLWSGYQYRCVVDGNNSDVITVRVVNTWLGSVNNNWENAGNWSCGIVPDANTDVVINTGTVIINSNVTCRTLTINPGVVFTVKPGFVLTITH